MEMPQPSNSQTLSLTPLPNGIVTPKVIIIPNFLYMFMSNIGDDLFACETTHLHIRPLFPENPRVS